MRRRRGEGFVSEQESVPDGGFAGVDGEEDGGGGGVAGEVAGDGACVREFLAGLAGEVDAQGRSDAVVVLGDADEACLGPEAEDI